MKRFRFKKTIQEKERRDAATFLAEGTRLSKSRVKEAMVKGAAWRTRGKKRLRLRRATARLAAGDRIEICYDEKILAARAPDPELLCDGVDFSAWYKPAGLLFSGTDFGDHASLLRQVERFFRIRNVYPVQRLDREVDGLCVVAHTAAAAARLSGQFREQKVFKRYRAAVLGDPGGRPLPLKIDRPIDERPALTVIDRVRYDPEKNISEVELSIRTGRRHQIRRHLDGLGHPVMGDPVYGKGNKNREGMKLTAVGLRFRCPRTGSEIRLELDELMGADGAPPGGQEAGRLGG